LDALVKVSAGDLRQAITLLQTAKKMSMSGSVSADDIFEMTGVRVNDHNVENTKRGHGSPFGLMANREC
jgi:DNA polymerase III delta prime subunit